MHRVFTLDCSILTVERLVASLGCWDQRIARFVRWVESLAPEQAALAFALILERACHRRAAGDKVLAEAAMLALLDRQWPEEHRVHTREAAAALELPITLAFLLAPVSPAHDDRDFEVPDYGGDRPLTLGERKALASRPSRAVIARALFDPHPMVTLKLLDNPKITEGDVLRSAARRPAPPPVLAELARHTRWRGRPRVAAALTHNPWTPHAHAASLLPGLPRALVREVYGDGQLSDELRHAAETLIESRPLPGDPTAGRCAEQGGGI